MSSDVVSWQQGDLFCSWSICSFSCVDEQQCSHLSLAVGCKLPYCSSHGGRNVEGFDGSDTRDEGHRHAGRELRRVGADMPCTRPHALAEGSHSSLAVMQSVDPSFLEMGLPPPSSFPCGCCGEDKYFGAFTELQFGSSCSWSCLAKVA